MKTICAILVSAFLFLGCAAMLIDRTWLDAGFTAEDYDRTKSWAALEVTPENAFAWEKAGFTPSYVDSGSDRTKLAKNMPDNKIFGYAPNVWTQNGFSQNEMGRALRSVIPSSRVRSISPKVFKGLRSIGVPPEEWRYCLDPDDGEKYDFSSIKTLVELKLSCARIDEWRNAGFTQAEAILWAKAGITDSQEAIGAKKDGYSPSVYAAIKAAGVPEEDWNYCINRGLAVKEAKAWFDVGVRCTRTTPKVFIDAKLTPAKVKPWVAARFDDKSIVAFIKRGFSLDEARSWIRTFNADFLSVNEMATWKGASFSPAEAHKWRALTKNAQTAKGYRNAGLQPDRIARFLLDNGVSSSAALGEYRKIKGACGSNFASDYAFLTRSNGDLSRYDPQGKCIIPSGFSREKTVKGGVALYRISAARRAKGGYEIDGYALVKYDDELPQILNNNVVLKPEEISYDAAIGAILNAKTVWKK
ncbi:MAG: hypothetical protein LBQ52_03430 [Helicobacteraceae bacterium]|jgi:hypothetical protein|nr:hypothetical protein [Helicobacteraceae bacterium]